MAEQRKLGKSKRGEEESISWDVPRALLQPGRPAAKPPGEAEGRLLPLGLLAACGLMLAAAAFLWKGEKDAGGIVAANSLEEPIDPGNASAFALESGGSAFPSLARIQDSSAVKVRELQEFAGCPWGVCP